MDARGSSNALQSFNVIIHQLNTGVMQVAAELTAQGDAKPVVLKQLEIIKRVANEIYQFLDPNVDVDYLLAREHLRFKILLPYVNELSTYNTRSRWSADFDELFDSIDKLLSLLDEDDFKKSLLQTAAETKNKIKKAFAFTENKTVVVDTSTPENEDADDQSIAACFADLPTELLVRTISSLPVDSLNSLSSSNRFYNNLREEVLFINELNYVSDINAKNNRARLAETRTKILASLLKNQDRLLREKNKWKSVLTSFHQQEDLHASEYILSLTCLAFIAHGEENQRDLANYAKKMLINSQVKSKYNTLTILDKVCLLLLAEKTQSIKACSDHIETLVSLIMNILNTSPDEFLYPDRIGFSLLSRTSIQLLMRSLEKYPRLTTAFYMKLLSIDTPLLASLASSSDHFKIIFDCILPEICKSKEREETINRFAREIINAKGIKVRDVLEYFFTCLQSSEDKNFTSILGKILATIINEYPVYAPIYIAELRKRFNDVSQPPRTIDNQVMQIIALLPRLVAADPSFLADAEKYMQAVVNDSEYKWKRIYTFQDACNALSVMPDLYVMFPDMPLNNLMAFLNPDMSLTNLMPFRDREISDHKKSTSRLSTKNDLEEFALSQLVSIIKKNPNRLEELFSEVRKQLDNSNYTKSEWLRALPLLAEDYPQEIHDFLIAIKKNLANQDISTTLLAIATKKPALTVTCLELLESSSSHYGPIAHRLYLLIAKEIPSVKRTCVRQLKSKLDELNEHEDFSDKKQNKQSVRLGNSSLFIEENKEKKFWLLINIITLAPHDKKNSSLLDQLPQVVNVDMLIEYIKNTSKQHPGIIFYSFHALLDSFVRKPSIFNRAKLSVILNALQKLPEKSPFKVSVIDLLASKYVSSDFKSRLFYITQLPFLINYAPERMETWFQVFTDCKSHEMYDDNSNLKPSYLAARTALFATKSNVAAISKMVKANAYNCVQLIRTANYNFGSQQLIHTTIPACLMMIIELNQYEPDTIRSLSAEIFRILQMKNVFALEHTPAVVKALIKANPQLSSTIIQLLKKDIFALSSEYFKIVCTYDSTLAISLIENQVKAMKQDPPPHLIPYILLALVHLKDLPEKTKNDLCDFCVNYIKSGNENNNSIPQRSPNERRRNLVNIIDVLLDVKPDLIDDAIINSREVNRILAGLPNDGAQGMDTSNISKLTHKLMIRGKFSNISKNINAEISSSYLFTTTVTDLINFGLPTTADNNNNSANNNELVLKNRKKFTSDVLAILKQLQNPSMLNRYFKASSLEVICRSHYPDLYGCMKVLISLGPDQLDRHHVIELIHQFESMIDRNKTHNNYKYLVCIEMLITTLVENAGLDFTVKHLATATLNQDLSRFFIGIFINRFIMQSSASHETLSATKIAAENGIPINISALIPSIDAQSLRLS